MKALPKRKGNLWLVLVPRVSVNRLNESPSEKEGKSNTVQFTTAISFSLNESPSEKEGKFPATAFVLPYIYSLNESPSEKEGKFR